VLISRKHSLHLGGHLHLGREVRGGFRRSRTAGGNIRLLVYRQARRRFVLESAALYLS
jgi:hypothetical protein